jgi:hypothetical protein
MRIVDYDLETEPFGPCNLAPEPICLAMEDTDGNKLLVASCEPFFDDVAASILTDYDMITNTNIAFDMAVLLAHRPKLSQLIWDAYRKDKVTCLILREKLLFLATTGNLKYLIGQNGTAIPLEYSQLAIEKRRLGIDRSEEKKADDAWRTNYIALKGIPAADYPEEARAYPLADAGNGLAIHLQQEKEAEALQLNPLRSQFLQARAGFALYLGSCWGMRIDKQAVAEKLEELKAEFDPKASKVLEDGTAKLVYGSLLESGILRPGSPPVPYVKHEEKAIAALGFKPLDWTPHIEKLSALGIKFKQPEAPSKDTKKLRAHIEAVCAKHEIQVILTDGGEASYSDEMLQELKGLDDIVDELLERNEIEKLVTTELPRMTADRVHPKYDPLKVTGRTGARGNTKKDKNPPYPSTNIQNPDKRIRNLFIADEGHVICSVDYNFIELVSAGQQCLELFNHSVLADKINAGYDPHTYLAASIYGMANPGWETGSGDGDYEKILTLKKEDPKTVKHFRDLAKPTGLGFPGGLGAARFIGYAKANFGVDLIKIAGGADQALTLAKQLKDRWRRTFPEMDAFFKYVTSQCRDTEWSHLDDERYCYQTPHGMIRRNCHYTEATNGLALQSRTAEGAKIALFRLAEACYDGSLGDIVYGCRNPAFIHDEVLVSIPNDDLMHERAFRVAEIMIEGMKQVMDRVKVGAAPAVMLRWDKRAEAVFNQDKRLQIWTPPKP